MLVSNNSFLGSMLNSF